MGNNNIAKSSNSIFVILISLFIIVFIIVAYFMLSGNMFDGAPLPDNTSTNKVNSSVVDEVFNIRDNIFSYNEAKAVCEAHDAKLASLEEMIQAYKNGGNWCSYGWSEGQLALYPTQPDFWKKLQNDPYKKNECGKTGVNGGYFANPNYKFGANCYGIKPQPKSNELENNRYGDSKLTAHDIKTTEYKDQLDKFRVSPFNEGSWSGCSV
jgi:hypothetical protein